MPSHTVVANRVKDLRELRGISKVQLCELAPVSRRELTLIENGHTPGLIVARRIARALGGSIDTLFPGDDE